MLLEKRHLEEVLATFKEYPRYMSYEVRPIGCLSQARRTLGWDRHGVVVVVSPPLAAG